MPIQVLIVDDNELQSKLVSFLLKEAGYEVQTVASGEQAIALLKSFQPQLILVDLQLPGMDGLELTGRLRFDPAYYHTVILALTAYADPCDLENARQAGCDGLIAKPIDAATFVELVQGFAAGGHPRVPENGHDLLAEIRNTFLIEGLDQTEAILKDLEERPGHAIEVARRVTRRWRGLGGMLGFPQISNQARRIEGLLQLRHPQEIDVGRAVKVAHRRFDVAMHAKPKLPLALVAGLRDVRIGLVHFSEDEANRIRSVVERSGIQASIEQLDAETIQNQPSHDVLILNECFHTDRELLPVYLRDPAIFIGPRSSLDAITALPLRTADFLIAPWDAEEVLMRVYRLIGKPTASLANDLAPGLTNRPRVLIADDDPDIVGLVREVLSQFEMESTVACSGREALEAIRRRPPDAVILDVNMLDLDGFEVLRRIRRNLITNTLPVLLLTGRNREADVAQGFRYGADDYIVKPFEPLELANRVERMIRAGSQMPSAPQPRRQQPSA